VASPSPGQNAVLYDVSITAAGGWASGWSYCSTSCPGQKLVSHTLILHWNGHSWSQDRSPDAEPYNILYGISGAAGHAAWAVGAPSCGACGSPPVFRTVILRWNGSDWSRVTPSPGGKWPLTGIAAEPGGGAIAVGRTIRVIHACTAPCDVTYEVDRTLILRWNGSRWSAVR
jgi:hypothetical protein